MFPLRRFPIILLILFTALSFLAPPHARSTPDVPANRPVAPTSKQLIHALLQNADVPLTVHASCTNAGPDAADATIGAYISGFLAEFSQREARNTIETSVKESGAASGGSVWRARVMMVQSQGEGEWRWGVEFDMRKSDGGVLRDSFRCLGAG